MPGSDTQPASPELRLTRWPHKYVVGGAIVLIVVIGAAGLTVGSLLRGPDDATLANSLRPVEVTTTVTTRQTLIAPFQAVLTAGSTLTLSATLPPGTSVAVITASPLKIGDQVHSGDLVAAISGRPIFALQTNVPLFRDLRMNDFGSDVTSLNQSLIDIGVLAAPAGDTYTYRTRIAVKALYNRASFQAEGTLGGESLPLREILDLPGPSLIVTQKTTVNTAVAIDSPVVTLQSQVNQLTVRVDTLSKRLLALSGTATIRSQSSAEERTAIIGSISEFRDQATPATTAAVPGNPGGTAATSDANVPDGFPGYDVGLTIDFGSAGNPWNPGSTLVVQFDVESASRTAVPLSAVREHGSGNFVWAYKGDNGDKVVKVSIAITDQADGYALIAPNKTLVPGDKIRVSP